MRRAAVVAAIAGLAGCEKPEVIHVSLMLPPDTAHVTVQATADGIDEGTNQYDVAPAFDGMPFIKQIGFQIQRSSVTLIVVNAIAYDSGMTCLAGATITINRTSDGGTNALVPEQQEYVLNTRECPGAPGDGGGTDARDGGVPDVGSDAGDAVAPDASEAGAPDAGVDASDAGATDAGAPDAGGSEGGPPDAGGDGLVCPPIGGGDIPSGTVPAECQTYCDQLQSKCGGSTYPLYFVDRDDCLFKCTRFGWPAGDSTDSSTNSTNCRINKIAATSPDLNACQRATPAGFANNGCDAPCADYCYLLNKLCGDDLTACNQACSAATLDPCLTRAAVNAAVSTGWCPIARDKTAAACNACL
jgi:hypothetical protein